VPARASALAAWGRDLARLARQADHPWNEGLWLDAQLASAAAAWRGEGLGEGDRGSDTLAT
jgi:hypothetical protein